MAHYRWNSPTDWLGEKIDKAAGDNNVAELVSIVNTIMTHIDNDDIQDDFQSAMDDDGFFQDLDITRRLSREACVAILEGISIEVTDDESVDVLRKSVQANLDDGTLSYSDIG